MVPVYAKFEVQNLRKQILTSLFESVDLKYKYADGETYSLKFEI